jgi:8-oxo-dGTP pyrophosphatase MutT (NUDIX family)
MELIPIVDSETLEFRGFAEREWCEKNNLCHLTTLLVPVFCDDLKVAVQIRPEGKSFAGCYDFFGGHICFDREFLGLLLGEPFDLSRIVWSAAVREANEELQVRREDGYPEIITHEHLAIIGDIGDFPLSWDQNVERSTLFIVKIPEKCSIYPMEEVDGRVVRVKTESLFLNEIQKKYVTGQWRVADGADRILTRLYEDDTFMEEVTRRMKTICQQ